MNRDGESTPLRATPARWLNPRFAPDGHRLAFAVYDGAQDDVWTYDWSRDALSRLTFDPAADAAPVWTPDASRIVFASTRHSRYPNLYWQRVDATGEIQRLTDTDRRQVPGSWDPNGKILAFTEYDSQTAAPILDSRTAAPTLMLLRLEGDEASGWRPVQPTGS